MELDKLSAIAQIVASIAVVATLAYLAVQTKQNTDAIRAGSRQATMLADITLASISADHPNILARSDNSALSAEEATQLASYLIGYLRIREFVWFQYKSGAIDRATFDSYMSPTNLLFASEQARAILDRFFGDPDFVAHIRALLAEE